MSLSPGQAAESLKDIEKTGRRSAEAYSYASASPNFIMWGLLWMVGYSGSYVLPDYGFVHGVNWLWFGLTVVGIIGSRLIGRRQYRHLSPELQAQGRAIGFRIGMTCFVLWLFLVATITVMWPRDPMALGAFVPLMVAAVYAIFGIWRGLRFLYIGIAVAALTLGGWLFLHEFFLPWMALVGGGSLILVGLWLRKV